MGDSSNACKFTGNTSSSFPGSAWGSTTATVVIETASFSFASASDSLFRFRKVTTPAVIRTSRAAPTRVFARPAGAGPGAEGRLLSRPTGCVWFCCVITGGDCTGMIAVSNQFSILLLSTLALAAGAVGGGHEYTPT